MTYRYLQLRGLMVGVFLVVGPILAVLAGGASAGLMHFATVMAGVALLAASRSAGNRPQMGSARYDASKIGERLFPLEVS